MVTNLRRAADHSMSTKVLSVNGIVAQIILDAHVLMLNACIERLLTPVADVVIRTEVCRTAAATCRVGCRSPSPSVDGSATSVDSSATTRMTAATSATTTRTATGEDRCRA